MNQLIFQIQQEVCSRTLELAPALSEADIGRFEYEHSVTLPEDFREFILQVENGGDGPPEYGLLPLGNLGPDCPPILADGYGDRLNKPFPLTEHWLWENSDQTRETEDRIQSLANGVLLLGADGCGEYWILVVSGQCRGEVWQLAEDGVQPCAPRRTFVSWYKYWLGGNDDWWAEFEV